MVERKLPKLTTKVMLARRWVSANKKLRLLCIKRRAVHYKYMPTFIRINQGDEK